MKGALMAVLVLVATIGAGFAQQSIPATKQAVAQPEFSIKELRLPVQAPESQIPGEIVTPQGRIRISPEVAKKLRGQVPRTFALTIPSNVCYTMNSFVFERYNGGDATQLVKQTTCTPASQFRVKKATITTSR